MTSRRLVELLVGTALIGYCAHALRSGGIVARTGLVTRAARPLAYWVTFVVVLAAGLLFVGGFVEWRE